MIQEIFPAVFEFSKKIREIDTLMAVVLYGSAVKGDMHKKSDIDLFLLFNAKHDPEKGEEAELVHKIAGEVEKKYKLKNPFSFVFLNYDEKIDTDFLWETAKDGTIIYAKPEIIIGRREWLKPMLLITYSFENASHKDKMFVRRKLYGYRVEKKYKGKKYVSTSEGFVNKCGEKIGKSSFLIPADKSVYVIELFDKYRIKYSIKKIWG